MANRTKIKYLIALGLCITLYILAVAGYAVWSNNLRKNLIMSEIDNKLLLAARSIKYNLAPDFHDRATGPGSISFEEEIRNRREINRFTSENGFKWTYTLTGKDGKFYFSAPSVSDEEAAKLKSWYFYPYEDIPDEFIKAFYERKIYFVNYTDQWGSFRSVAVPLQSPGGKTYLACADLEISYMKTILRENLITSLISAVYFIVFSLPFIIIIRLSYVAYTKHLRRINEELSLHKTKLEDLVQERTEELSNAYVILQDELKARETAEEKLREEKEKLETALHEVKTLSGLIPICASCKKIRDDSGYWNQIEKYIQEHSDATFSHGICPDCAEKLYPGIRKRL